jgi:hypothetical protein
MMLKSAEKDSGERVDDVVCCLNSTRTKVKPLTHEDTLTRKENTDNFRLQKISMQSVLHPSRASTGSIINCLISNLTI